MVFPIGLGVGFSIGLRELRHEKWLGFEWRIGVSERGLIVYLG